MSNSTTGGFWGDIGPAKPIRTPLNALEDAADELSTKTSGYVYLKIHKSLGNPFESEYERGTVTYICRLFAPLLDYTFTLFTVKYNPALVFPAQLIYDDNVFTSNTSQEFDACLKDILTTPKVLSMVNSLWAQANDSSRRS